MKTAKVEEKKEEITKEKTAENKSTESKEELTMMDFNKKDIPSDVKYDGKIIDGKRWMDKNGENIIILTKTGVKRSNSGRGGPNDGELQSAELFGYNYIKKNGEWSLLWKISDNITKCDFDLTLDFINKSLTVTDINNNGIAESTFLYKLSSRSDVSPSELKLMMHEGETKYALRGNMYINIPGNGEFQGMKEGGDYKVDKAFEDAPSGFLDYAKEQWKKFKTEKLN